MLERTAHGGADFVGFGEHGSSDHGSIGLRVNIFDPLENCRTSAFIDLNELGRSG